MSVLDEKEISAFEETSATVMEVVRNTVIHDDKTYLAAG